jgi:hypothetical protein
MQNHKGSPFNAPEPRMLNFQWQTDEFRIYNKALSEIEINAIVIEKQGEDKDVTKNC